MSELLKRKIDEQNRLHNRMQDIQRAAEEEARDWTAEERTNWDAANDKIDEVSADIERLEKASKRDKIDYRQVIEGQGTGEPPADRDAPNTAEARDAAYDAAFRGFMRRGMDGLTVEQRQLMLSNEVRDQGVTTPSSGGYLVPPGYRALMTESLKAYGGLLNQANVITTSTGQPLQWPTNDDTGNTGAILGENTVIPQLDIALGTRAIGAYTYTSKLVKVSLQLLQDSAFNLDNWLPRKLGQRIGRAVANHLINGTGTGEPTGILAGATNFGGTALSVANFNAAATTAGAAPGYDALIDLEHSVDPAYRTTSPAMDPSDPADRPCRFLLSDAALKNVRKYKDNQGRPVYLPVPVPGMPATINGNPYTIDQGMPQTFAIGTKAVLFGNFYEAYVVRQVLDVQAVRLSERYADFLQVGFFGFMRLDATPDDAGAVRALNLS